MDGLKQQRASEAGKRDSREKPAVVSSTRSSTKPTPAGPLLQLPQKFGNQALGHFIQAKLKVSQPGDSYEQEADRVADQVMRMADPTSNEPGEVSIASPQLQRACNTCEATNQNCGCDVDDKEDRHLQAKTASDKSATQSLSSHQQILPLTSSGEPLAEKERSFFEPRFGYDLSHVRVHRDGPAFDSARSVNALAYTMGHHVVFGAGQYAPQTESGRRLLAHELTHVIQQRQTASPALRRKEHQRGGHGAQRSSSMDEPAAEIEPPKIQASPPNLLQRSAGDTATGAPPGGAPNPGGAPARRGGFEIDVLAAEAPDDFLVRAAGRALGVDLRVSSMDDMINQVEAQAGAGSCVRRLNVYNHANPSIQTVSGGNKAKTATGERTQRPLSGFSIDWLTTNANQAALNRLRHSFCCDGQMNWWGCSTAGVWAEGGTRTAAEQAEDAHRYTGVFGNWYHDVAEAAAHGASSFRYVGMVNVQSWANALCAPVVGATDFNNWRTVGGEVFRTVIHGGRQVRVMPQGDVGCGCDPATGRVSGAAQTSAQLQQRSEQLRAELLRPLYEQTRGVIGTAHPAQPESATERTTRDASEQAQAQASEQLGNAIRDAVLSSAGFAAGARPANADEALRVATLWGLSLDNIVAALPTLTTSLSGMLRGSHEEAGLDQTQRNLETALTQAGRESFMAALMSVRRERFWDDYLSHNTVYIFPDLTGPNRYRGFTQVATRTTEGSRPQTIFVIHVSKDLLELRQAEMVAANIVHELSHSAYGANQIGRSMQAFETDLAGLIVDHPRVAALRTGAADAAAARSTHLSRIKQMLYEVSGYGEEEIFVHLQQLTHQPSMTIDGAAVRGSDFILSQVELFMRRLRRIGMPPRVLNQVLAAIRRQASELYDRRIAMAPAGSTDRRALEISKEQALLIFQMALSDSAAPPRSP